MDEADRMLDMGFEKDIMNIIYNSDIKQQRTNLLFSLLVDVSVLLAILFPNK